MIRNASYRVLLLHSLKRGQCISIGGIRLTNTSSLPSEPQPASLFLNEKEVTLSPSIVEELRNPRNTLTGASKVSSKSFNEIDESVFELNENQGKTELWSSSYDPVTRSPFAKDVIHLQSLLEALLASRNYARAENILMALHPLSEGPRHFLTLVNKYLESFALDELTTFNETDSFFKRMASKYRIHPDDRTYAIFIYKSYCENGNYMAIVSKTLANPQMSKKVFSHMDVIPPSDLAIILKNPEIKEYHVAWDLRVLFNEIRDPLNKGKDNEADVPKYFKNEKAQAPTLETGAAKLRSVDSFGLKVIRHTLLGLEGKEDLDLQNIVQDLNHESSQHLLHNLSDGKKRNFHEIFKSLKTEEDKQKFCEVLETYNEKRQRELESKGIDGAREKWKYEFEDMKKRGGLKLSKNLNVLLYIWYKDMLPLVEEETKLCQELLDNEIDSTLLDTEQRNQMKDRSFYAPFLVLIPPKKLTVITVLELLKLNSTGGVVDGMRTARAVISVGKAIELEYRSQLLVKTQQKFLQAKGSSHWSKILKTQKADQNPAYSEQDWDYPVYAKLGSVLTSFLLQVARVQVTGTEPSTGKRIEGMQPAFHHTHQFVHGQKLGIIKLHKQLVNSLASNTTVNSVQPQLLPMLTPPLDWTSHRTGGYRFSPSTLVRIKDSAETIAYVKAASDSGRLDGVYAGLNVLGKTAWSVNAKVLEVISHYWNTGNEFLDIPPIVEEPKLPEPLPKNAEPLEKVQYAKKVRNALNQAASFRSQRCDTNYKLEIARAYVGEKMYFPHNVDFRGRAYPLPPHLNHLGNDLTRSLFVFWEGVELGESGLRWLKIHLANLYGYDKASLEERVQFVDDNLENICKVAENPIANEEWWSKADKPWQVLSVCFELNEAHKLSDPRLYVSYIPVHQDGTCNGLQHYAALGGDIEGAKQVNLVPSDRPQDVYKFVASLVEKRLEVEAATGKEEAIFLKGKISRKIVKQTVMTNVYGVTFVGAVAQIEKQLSGLFGKDDYATVQKHSRYLTSLVFASIRELFAGAHLIQDWLGESAKRISKSVRIDYEDKNAQEAKKPNHLSSVIWTTPLGLPCVQPYRAILNQVVSTNLQDISISDPWKATQVDARKQQTAFPPNFIHSLDATHMLMTAAACGREELSFASVHDSYWTHAANVDRMNVKIRESFVKLHEESLIVRLRDEFEKRYKGFLQVVFIPGEHDLARKVKKIRKDIVKDLKRGLTVADEIYIERKRQELLQSPDATKQKLGREMVTTVSVAEEYDVSKFTVTSAKSKAIQVLVPLKFPDIPERGSLDVQVVKDSPYFFS
ncbi:DNA/RNA polymerase [Metschnikowia bicuspidata var. bicuspidata NRRL YB-4993]|uniref:DNA-directed RNA polymerase n=1 Tax=Metschnikowia bicuspidata var. bicuspidata NRRL YB-4993 TaxID=869754 RepID=A0A1A0HGT7_9ASCO|nr:DNA/RNA polymerase [Metschnikowia bicuspidata var. bicuspidata NRRL YB-4993]OBA23389.1 DNA/RNA polymerase [Metschnikowia bicuspidata var. bicuspidata NRRL YB-4993]